MIGPSGQVLINMGARYPPCMHFVKSIQGAEPPGVAFLCPNATTDTEVCPLKELCGFGNTVPNPIFDGQLTANEKPNQWWRFIIPIFMHAGLVHIGFNLLMQLTIARDMEKGIGSIRFFLVYMSAGIFGFVMGGNFAAPGIASTGASGSLFGIIALTLLDLLYSWQERKNPVKELVFVLLDMVVSFVLGLLPGLDKFYHNGGFLMGLCLGVCVLHSPNALRKRLGEEPPYSAMQSSFDTGPPSFTSSPMDFFQGRKPLWWAWWVLRVGLLVLIVVVFIVLLNNFYSNNPSTCSWCKYLSCIVSSPL
jgi:membrane associated rhomboid family serine protease